MPTPPLAAFAAIAEGDGRALAALPDLDALDAWLDQRDVLLAEALPALEAARPAMAGWPVEARTALAEQLAAVEDGTRRLEAALAEGQRTIADELAGLRRWTAYQRYPVGQVPMHQRLDIRR